jgi:hypothetical protein
MSSNSQSGNETSEVSMSVGYGKPPRNTRFKKGVSGNPNGRPKGSQNVAGVFLKTLKEKVVINENGRRKTITKLQAAIKQLVNKAASGDLRALYLLMNLSREAEAQQPSNPDKSILGEFDQKVVASIVRRFQNVTDDYRGDNANPNIG